MPISGVAPFPVAFTDTSSGATAWLWSFGDGATASTQHTAHVYLAVGVYPVTLAATTPKGVISISDVVTVVSDPADVAAYTPPSPAYVESPGADPQVMLRLSNDGGKTWITEQWRSAGRVRPGHEKQFNAWFGDSKAVNAKGEPLTVYHGGPETIREFKSGREGGIFLASHPSVAGEYADARRGATYPAHLSMQNPLIHDAAVGFKRNDVLVREARAKGHDGVIVRNTYDGIRNDGRSPMTDVFIVFDPAQIKSATGNRGTYRRDSADIRE
jgi:PKD repeat protein